MVKTATPMVTGLVLTAVKRTTAKPGGVEQLTSMLQRARERVGSRDLAAFVNQADPAKTTDLLDSLTGGNTAVQVTANLAHKSGLDLNAVGTLIGVLSPAVLSQLGAMAKDQNLDTQGLVDLIGDNADELKGLGNLDYIPDDVPGIGDDIQRKLNKLFGRG